MKWKTIRLGDLFTVGKQTVDPASFSHETFHLYSVPAYDSRVPDTLIGEEIGSAKQVVAEGDVLLCRIVPHIRRAWVVGANTGRRIIASSEWIVLRNPRVYPDYLRHFLLSDVFHSQFMLTVAGVGGSLMRARPAAAAEIEVPLPPLEEQRRIAAILDKADALRQKRRLALQKLDSLSQSIFLDMFGDPATNPQGWPVYELGSLLDLHEYGPRFYNESYTKSGVRIVRITDLDARGNLNFSAMPRLDVDDIDQRKYVLRPGDIVFARTGATVGKLALIKENDPHCIAGAYFIRMHFDSGRIIPEYIRAVLASSAIQLLIAKQSRQAAQQNFSGPALRRLRIPLPPRSMQVEFAKWTSKLFHIEETQRRSGRVVDVLIGSLQSRAFQGAI